MYVQVVLFMIQLTYEKRDVNMIRTLSEIENDILKYKFTKPDYYEDQLSDIAYTRALEDEIRRDAYFEGYNNYLSIGKVRGKNKAIKKLLDSGMSEEELAKRLNRSPNNLILKEKKRKDKEKIYIEELKRITSDFIYWDIKKRSYDLGLKRAEEFFVGHGKHSMFHKLVNSGMPEDELNRRLGIEVD